MGTPDKKSDNEFSDSDGSHQFDETLWGSRDNPFHPEYEGDYKLPLNGTKRKTWEDLLITSQRDGLRKFGLREGERKCPYLQLASGSTYFYYCLAAANSVVTGKNGIKFSGRVPKEGSAEAHSECGVKVLGGICSGKFDGCDVFKGI